MKRNINQAVSPLAETPLADRMPGVQHNGDAFVTDWQLPNLRRFECGKSDQIGRCSTEYLNAMAEASAAVRKILHQPSKFALMSFEVKPRMVAMIIAFLIALGIIFGVGYSIASAASEVSGKYRGTMTHELAD